MKKAVVLGLVALLVIGSAVAVHAKAEKEDLYATPVPKQFSQTGTVAGFVILNNPAGTNNLIVEVSLKGGASNATYGVYLEKYSAAFVWLNYTYLGDLTTNRQGKGNAHFNPSLTPGVYCLQIAVGAGWNFASNGVAITLK